MIVFSNNKIIRDPKNPFKNDYTEEYEKIAENLTKISSLEAKDHPLVLSIDGSWGKGKTCFIDMWGQYLITKGFIAIKFDAWEHDYSDFPLQAIISELIGQLQKTNGNQKTIDALLRIGKTLCRNFAPAFVKFLASATMEHLNINNAGADFVKDLCESTSNSIEEVLGKYNENKNIITDFKKSLSKICGDKTLYLFVDELDRCKPSFAVSVLEVIKHFFDITNLCCIISTNMDALSMSITKIYGYTQDYARSYLERFIDIPIKLPEPNHARFIQHKIEKEIFLDMGAEHKEILIKFVETCCSKLNMSLREIEKYLRDIRIFSEYNQSRINAIPKFYYIPILYEIAKKRIWNDQIKMIYLNFFSSTNNKYYRWSYEFFISSHSEEKLIAKIEDFSSKILSLTRKANANADENEHLKTLENIEREIMLLYGRINHNQSRTNPHPLKSLERYSNHFEKGNQIVNLIGIID